MKIDLRSIDSSQFSVEENIILSTGRSVYFVHPNPAGVIEWNQSNAHLRSSVWDKNGSVVSAGFKKFFELGENEKFAGSPADMNNVFAYEKVDGTLLIVSQYGRHCFIRTRGRLDAETIDKKEIDFFKRKILRQLNDYYGGDTWGISFLFEWISPKHRQVVNYGSGETFFVLVGIVHHEHYTLLPQKDVDATAANMGFNRPQRISATTLSELKTFAENWKDREGVVIYSNNGQTIHKLKSKWYKAFHKLFDKGPERENIIDAWSSCGNPSYNDFIDRVARTFTPEYANKLKGEVSTISDAWKQVADIIGGMREFIDKKLAPLSPACEVEGLVKSAYGTTNRAEFVLKLYRGQTLTDDDRKKLLYQCIKNH